MCNLITGLSCLCLIILSGHTVSGFVLGGLSTTPATEVCEDSITECAVLNVAIALCNETEKAMRVCPRYCGLCPRDGNWSEWGEWGGCDVTCGNGTITRTRLCDNPTPFNGGRNCTGSDEDYEDCQREPCPVDGEWGEWGNWTDCSRTCGSGLQKRRRECDNPPPSRGGKPCSDDSSDYQICTLTACTDTPISTTNTTETAGGWSSWGNWSTCSASCGPGLRRRERSCDNPTPTSYTDRCMGDSTEFDVCIERYCTGEWAAWGNWSICSVTCGIGLRHRERDCDNTDNTTARVTCTGRSVESDICSLDQCQSNTTIASAWGVWSNWSSCSVTCGTGLLRRQRECYNGDNVTKENSCIGDYTETDICTLDVCESNVTNTWGQWSNWSDCSVTCGTGVKRRDRSCGNAENVTSKDSCIGDFTDFTSCFLVECKKNTTDVGSWSFWGQWSDCSVTCDNGLRRRERDCYSADNSTFGSDCFGDYTEVDTCFVQPCMTNATWTSWGNWSSCSVSCGVGLRTRARECQGASNSTLDKKCDGVSVDTDICTLEECERNVTSHWGQWSNWNTCSVTCGTGLIRRQRDCYGGDNVTLEDSCIGDYTEVDICISGECLSNVTSDWGLWSNWSACSVTCGTGLVRRHRDCFSGDNVTIEDSCIGDYTDTDICTPRQCESNITSSWGTWSNWSGCSVTCGTGLLRRHRACVNNENVTDEDSCIGDYTDADICTLDECGTNITSSWSSWSNWSGCSVTCGTGLLRRQRECYSDDNVTLEFNCNGDYTESDICTPGECESNITSTWGLWSNWSACSVSCGSGLLRRYRECYSNDNMTEEYSCIGDYTETDICTLSECGRNNTWSQWSNWGECSVTCGSGLKRRERSCVDTENVTSTDRCEGDFTDFTSCLSIDCKKNTSHAGSWSFWGQWSSCSATCGTGLRRRNRDCYSADNSTFGSDCFGDYSEMDTCFEKICIGNATWGPWSNWSSCSVSCDIGIRTRERDCYGADNSTLDNSCLGAYTETDICLQEKCEDNSTLNDHWGHWGNWSSCSVTCGIGLRRRERDCFNAGNLTTGENCIGDFTDFDSCFEVGCDSNTTLASIWETWSNWSSCSETCGIGVKRRHRECQSSDNTTQEYNCIGDYTETDICLFIKCVDNNTESSNWGVWGNWSSCSTSCGPGLRRRERDCYSSDNITIGHNCLGDYTEFDSCSEIECGQNTSLVGVWGSWGNWSTCSVSCGIGLQRRERDCHGSDNSTKDYSCHGDYTETDMCVENKCATNVTSYGDWGLWGNWSSCSVTCGIGLQRRERECYYADNLTRGNNCIGDFTDTNICVQEECLNNITISNSWGEWGDWSGCSSICGQGLRRRQRDCYNNDNSTSVSTCIGDYTDFDGCYGIECNGSSGNKYHWGNWESWSDCSASCGYGVRRRGRDCSTADNSTADTRCTGDFTEYDVCVQQECKTNLSFIGEWQNWQSWETCSVSCGVGIQKRTRECLDRANVTDMVVCSGESLDIQACTEQACAGNASALSVPGSAGAGQWTEWQEWSTCSVSCGNGIRRRERQCNSSTDATSGYYCLGDYTDITSCVEDQCGENMTTGLRSEGQWSIWGEWSECSASCGAGIKRRERNCSNHDNTSTNDVICRGDFNDFNVCVLAQCSGDMNASSSSLTGVLTGGNWTVWGSWSQCSVTCGYGLRRRDRQCYTSDDQTSRAECPGDFSDLDSCYAGPCANDSTSCSQVCNNAVASTNTTEIAGGWGSWGKWSTCSSSCGPGLRRRERSCDNPTSTSYTGRCMGEASEFTVCTSHPCSNWGDWSPWTDCSVSCGYGLKLRHRECQGPNDGTPFACIGDAVDRMICAVVCPDQLGPGTHGHTSTGHTSAGSSAFSATISAPGQVQGSVRFLVEHVNTGHAYNSKTGEYTCPAAGLYFFSTTLSTMSDYLNNHNLDTVECYILQNTLIRRMNLQIDRTDDDADKESYSISASLALHLMKGDTVQIGECSDPAAFYSDSSFTGFLISPDP